MKKKKKHVAVYLPEEIVKKISSFAEKDFISVSQYIAKLVINSVKEKEL